MGVEALKSELQGLATIDKLKYLADKYADRIIFSTSFGWEDQAITHLIFANNIPVKVFTLETGRLFPETYYVWNRTLEVYNKPIHAYYPKSELLQDMVNT
ncbi:MAG: phosphoadenylyl-sulfate reductase, partial [Chitinophagaceae bacterium]